MEQFTKKQLDTIFFALDAYQHETEDALDGITGSLDRSYKMKTKTEEEVRYMKLFRKNADYQIALLEERNKEINLLRNIIREGRCKITTEMKGDKE